MGAHLWDQLCARRGDGHSHGISVRHQLVAFLALCRWRDRSNPGHGRHVRILPGIGLPGAFPVWREEAQPARALVVGGCGISRLVAFRILYRRHRCLDAESRGLRTSARWLRPAQQFLGIGAEPVGLVAVRAQHERRGDHRRFRDGFGGSLLSAIRQAPRARTDFPAHRCRGRLYLQPPAAFPYRRWTGPDGGAAINPSPWRRWKRYLPANLGRRW